MFYSPKNDTVIGPINNLIDMWHPRKYRNYSFKEYMDEFYRQEGKRRRVKEAFELNLTLTTSVTNCLKFLFGSG